MPSQEHLQQKEAIVSEIKTKLEKAKSLIIVDYRGITVEEANSLRKSMREAGVEYIVYKNTMVSRAIKDTAFESLDKYLSGPGAFAFGYDDAVAPAKVVAGFIKEHKKMEFKAGVIEGHLFDAEGIKAVASLPSRDELIAKFMGSIQSPVSKMVRTLQAIADQKAE